MKIIRREKGLQLGDVLVESREESRRPEGERWCPCDEGRRGNSTVISRGQCPHTVSLKNARAL